jgi:hypothetical protein
MADAYRTRAARLDDAQAIAALFCAQVPTWQRLDDHNRVQDVPYDSLSLFEKWQHGAVLYAGMWMATETAAIYLNRLLYAALPAPSAGPHSAPQLPAAVPPIVATAGDDAPVCGYAELHIGEEAAPVGRIAHIAQFALAAEHGAAAEPLLRAVIAAAQAARCARITFTAGSAVAAVAGDAGQAHNVHVHDVLALLKAQRVSLAARTGQIFYKVTDLPGDSSEQIAGWTMPLGRATSAQHQWEQHVPRTFDPLLGAAGRRRYRLRLSAGGNDALLVCVPGEYDARTADILLWTPKVLAPPLISGLRDWAHREGYRTLTMLALENAVGALGPEAEADPLAVTTLAFAVPRA